MERKTKQTKIHRLHKRTESSRFTFGIFWIKTFPNLSPFVY
ncbi:hypothetical protein LEP1GSC124_5361, partial [Leptospira interrogans serovar Pyrogenes str. 200701872]